MKIRYLKLKNWLLLSAMSLFGLSACHSSKEAAKADVNKDKETPGFDSRQIIAMYGVPARDMKTENVEQKAEIGGINEEPRAREPQVTVYGVPTVDYAVKGRVVDSKGKPVKGLRVTLINSDIDPDNLPDTPHWKEQMARVSDTTDKEGNFDVRTSDRPWEKVRVLVTDIDGDKNGTFEPQLLDVQFGEPVKGDKPMSSWNLGEKKAEVTVEMKSKK